MSDNKKVIRLLKKITQKLEAQEQSIINANAEVINNSAKEERLIDLLNKLSDINPKIYQVCSIPVASGEELAELEKEYPELVITKKDDNWVMTIPSLLATITSVLCNKKLAFQYNKKEDTTIGFEWLDETN